VLGRVFVVQLRRLGVDHGHARLRWKEEPTLADQVLRRSRGGSLSPDVRGRVLAEPAGNPLGLVELARAMPEAGDPDDDLPLSASSRSLELCAGGVNAPPSVAAFEMIVYEAH
jgi:hypothetical protein